MKNIKDKENFELFVLSVVVECKNVFKWLMKGLNFEALQTILFPTHQIRYDKSEGNYLKVIPLVFLWKILSGRLLYKMKRVM